MTMHSDFLPALSWGLWGVFYFWKAPPLKPECWARTAMGDDRQGDQAGQGAQKEGQQAVQA